MKRGDIAVVAMSGDHGKPRPTLILQSDLFNETHSSITVAPITSTLVDAPLFRLTLEPSGDNGLKSVSQLMIDKITTVRRDRMGRKIGLLDDDAMIRVSRAVLLWLGLSP
jgi:mRNA interferase MazF